MERFTELPNFWVPVFPASELGQTPKAITVAGERLALFRGANGVGAVMDRCPHRGVSLSLGEVVDGCLACPFHGWRFAEDGSCAHVPFNPTVDRGRLGAEAVPVREQAGLIWIFTGGATDTEPVLPELASRPGVVFGYLYEDWGCHWTRAMENMLDNAHLPFVHRATIGRGMRKALRLDTVLKQELVDTEHGYDIHAHMDEGVETGFLQFVRPNGMVLHILEQPGRTMRIHVWCVPMELNRTRLLVAVAYDFGVLSGAASLSTFINRKIVFEDRAVVESSQPTRVPRPKDEKNVPTDLATLRFRRWYFEQIAPTAGD